jgi:hypothetical protein
VTLSYVLRSIVERATARPLLVRDRVLRARSNNSLVWHKDPSMRLTYPSHTRAHMTYFAARDTRGRLWIRASVHDAATDSWHTEIGRPGQPARAWWDARRAGLMHFYAPTWCGGLVYGVGEAPDGMRRLVCFRTGDDGIPAAQVEQNWESIGRLAVVEDVCILRVGGEFHAWVSAGASPTAVQVHHWRSQDGVDWRYDGVALTAPVVQASFELANNPSIVAADGGWRMYFRTGDRPALGNVIRSAFSDDLRCWRHEQGVRIAPGGRWDSHGVGFPSVWREPGGGWVMLYAGYWGRGTDATVERYWRALGEKAQA